MLDEDDYKSLHHLLNLASSTLHEAKQTLRDGPDHWAKEQIEKMLTQLSKEICCCHACGRVIRCCVF